MKHLHSVRCLIVEFSGSYCVIRTLAYIRTRATAGLVSMPAYCKDNAVGVGAEVVGCDELMGIEVDLLSSVLVSHLGYEIFASIAKCQRAIMGYLRHLEISVLAVKSRIDGYYPILFEGTLASIAGIDIKAQDGNNFKAKTEGVSVGFLGLMVVIVLQSNHAICAYLESH